MRTAVPPVIHILFIVLPLIQLLVSYPFSKSCSPHAPPCLTPESAGRSCLYPITDGQMCVPHGSWLRRGGVMSSPSSLSLTSCPSDRSTRVPRPGTAPFVNAPSRLPRKTRTALYPPAPHITPSRPMLPVHRNLLHQTIPLSLVAIVPDPSIYAARPPGYGSAASPIGQLSRQLAPCTLWLPHVPHGTPPPAGPEISRPCVCVS